MRLLLGFENALRDFGIAVSNNHPDRTADMKLDDDLLFADEIPADARVLIELAEKTADEVKRHTERTVEAIRDAAEREVQAIRAQAEKDVGVTEAESARKLSPMLRDLFTQLKQMQVSYAQNGHLDEALAIRARLRIMRSDLFGVKPDPGNMTDFGPSDIGKSMIYEVVGSTEGTVWGTDAFTGDTRLAVAAVHAGALRVGERGLVRVTLIDGSERVFDGSEQNGIRSLDYGNYSVGFQLERV